jgi:tetratricopeptide (TPR) repeat protein
MRFRLGFMLASVLAVSAAGCAGGGGGGGGGGAPSPQGARIRETSETNAAERALNLAMVAGPEAGAPQYETALSSSRAAIAADSMNPLGYKLAGQALIGLGRLQEAAEMLDQAEALRPAYLGEETEGIRETAWIDAYQKAEPLLTSGDYLGAAEILEGANAIYKQRPEIMIVLGQIYVQENQPDRAITYLREADAMITRRAADPALDTAMVREWRTQQADIPVQIAQALIAAERFDEAAVELRALVAANPDNILYASNLATIYVQSNQPDSASAAYQRLLQRRDLSPGDLYNIGIGYYQLQRYADAARVFQRAATESTKDRDALEMWVRSIQIQHSRDSTTATPASLQELIGAGERWLALDPNARIGYAILTQAVFKTGNEARTQELLDKTQALKVATAELQMQRNPAGGATVVGDIENLTADPGTRVTLTFTFYNKAGNAIGTQTVTAQTGAAGTGGNPGARTPIRVTFTSDQQVDGYSYTLQ